ncbi:alpha-amylase family glycosyl hydrolase [Sungkyunkwania multivorans]|uniref:Alpha-amylase family glycosyl hydrolase n=1 Tax=Sungkyunkwania multivorans TaxID=1173618 RepID=A0ABW3D0Q0_9FLAO
MKKIVQLSLLLLVTSIFAQVQNVTFDISPPAFNEDELITITVSGLNRATWGLTADDVNDPLSGVYLWMWRVDGSGQQDSPTNGLWTDSDESQRMTYNSVNDEYTFQLTPDAFFGTTGITQIGMLVKANDGTGDKKSQDNLVDVGRAVVQLVQPTGAAAVADPNVDFDIRVRLNTGGSPVFAANYEVFLNNISVATAFGCGTPTCLVKIPVANLTDGEIRVVGTNPSTGDSNEASFELILAPSSIDQALPAGLVDGINYDADPTKATLVLTAPLKDYVLVAGSFNNYSPSTADIMKRDATTGKFWLELTGLTPGQVETYQYWVYDASPIANSPGLVKAADPYSTLVLSPFDDPFIPAVSYPNLPTYPAGQEREVTVLQTGQTPYNWQVTNFSKPKEEDLIIYEVLVRDFDANRNYQDLIDRIEYFKDLNINAIQLMPVMEFEGNESWGYNTSFHMALDKFYGTPDKFKELIDVCHQNGIAVILDIAFNHAFGRNPLIRMWMNDPDGDGWGGPSSENPYFNETALHAYSVGDDFDHSSQLTQDYVKQVTAYWINEYKIDGFRWDLTKGFTQNCPGAGESCTNQYQPDRVAVLKEYADHTWAQDPDHYVIFEHLGDAVEEKEWADYRLGEGKGIMMWREMFESYKELTLGFTADISGIGHNSSSFNGKRMLGYAESHDKDRLMYEAIEFGNQSNPSHDVRDLNTALSRIPAIGAFSLMVPGPKMIWHFQELGMNNSIYTCNNGVVNTEGDAIPGDCKLDTKPQPQWAQNWLADPNRRAIYDSYATLITLKINEPVFEGDYSFSSYNNNNLLQRLYIFDTSLPSNTLKSVVVVANFDVVARSIDPNFPTDLGNTWYNLSDNSSIDITSRAPIMVPPGQFVIYGNEPNAVLSSDEFSLNSQDILIYPNPASDLISVDAEIERMTVYNIAGKAVKSFKGNNDSKSYDIRSLSSGLYFVKVTSVDGNSETLKFIKQ